MELNKYQTPIEELSYIYVDEKTGEQTHYTWNNCPEEIKEEFNEHLATIPFIQHLVSKDRPYCKDLPRDENGRAIWKVTEPPIIEDTDYFRQTAIHFQNTGRYTDLRPNPNPNSAYRKWIEEEVNRIYNGMLRESDGAWIPGDMYWYLNYAPIILTKDGESETTGERDTDMPKFWEGILWRYIGWTDARRVGQNFAEIAKRGASKSYSVAAKLSKTFIMGNRRRTEEEIRARKPQNAGGVVVAYDKQFLIRDGTLNKFEQMIDHCANNTEFPRKTLQRTLNDMSWESGYIDLNTGAKAGTRNTVLGVAVKDDVDKIRGKRKEFICFEEFGKFPNLSDAYNISLKSVKEGNKWFGEIVLVGTGGEEGNDFSSAMDMIYHPTGFFLRAFDNVWDKAGQSRGTSIFFFPAYVNRAGCYNNDGISDVTLALFSICCDRYIAKYHNPDPMQITRTKAEDPVTIQDAIMRRDGTKFPVAQITERIQEIDLNPNFYDNLLVGKLIQRSNGEVVFEPTGDTPIRKFPTKDNKVAGAVEIKELPVKGSGGKPMAGRYIAGLDPIDDDQANTMSLVSIFILDLWTDSIVAEWTGRLESADACYEVCRLLCIFYNAKCNYENNKKGFYSYMKMRNCLQYLEEELEIVRAKSNNKMEKLGNKLYGINASTPINNWGRDLLKDYMLKPIVQVKNGEDDDEVTIPNVMTWWNRALLEEARQWNPDGNFDRISAMGMLMLIREDRRAKFGEDFNGLKSLKVSNPKAKDPFFEKNYNHGKEQLKLPEIKKVPAINERVQWQ